MKSLNLFLILLAVLNIFCTSAQENSKPIKRVNISDVYLQTGIFILPNPNSTLEDFKALNSESTFLNQDLTAFSPSSGIFGYSSISASNSFCAMMGIRFSDKEKTKYKTPLLRLGISSFSGPTLQGYLHKTENIRYDTLTSNQTGFEVFFLDSTKTESYSMHYTSSMQLRLDISLIFRTNPEFRWSLFGGVGISAGASFNSYSYISQINSLNLQTNDVYGNYISSDWQSTSVSYPEITNHKTNIGGKVYLPMGIDFRIGKKNEFLKLIHLFYELRPGINMTSIPELRTFTNLCFQQGLGIRVSW